MADSIDDRLFQRFLDGDMEALALLESGSRNIVERLLSTPGFGLAEPKARRFLANAVVGEVLERPARDLDTLVVSLIVAACRRGVEHLRRDGARNDSTHLPPGVLVNMALMADAMALPTLTAAQTHTEDCELCRRHLDLVKEATARATHVPSADEREPDALGDDPTDQQPREGASSDHATAFTLEGLARETAAELRTFKAEKKPPSKVRSRVLDPRRAAARVTEVRRYGWIGLLALVVAAGASYLFLTRHDPAYDSKVGETLASLAVRAPPQLPAPDRRPDLAASAFQDLENGNCLMAATRFRKARLQEPQRGLLWYYEALSFLCGGDASASLDAFEGLASRPDPEARNVSWYRAQAALLAGDGKAAISYLKEAQRDASSFREIAWDQQKRIEEILR